MGPKTNNLTGGQNRTSKNKELKPEKVTQEVKEISKRKTKKQTSKKFALKPCLRHTSFERNSTNMQRTMQKCDPFTNET